MDPETSEHECPYCGAAPSEPCRNQRYLRGTVYGFGLTTVVDPTSYRPTKRIHPERREQIASR